jgi:hypothetical protein
MYYILKFSDSWTLYDANSGTSQPLERSHIDTLKALFTKLVDQDKIIIALQVTSISPNKLLNIEMPLSNGKAKGNQDTASRPVQPK